MDEQQEAARALVRRMMDVTGLDATNFAREAGVNPTTLTRFLNDRAVKHTLSAKTMSKLSKASGVPVPMVVAKGRHVKPDERRLPGLRFRALCDVVWKTSGGLDQACKDLDITRADLDAIAAGKTVPNKELVLQLCGLTQAPLAFIEKGEIERVPPALGVWLGHLYPELIPALRDNEG